MNPQKRKAIILAIALGVITYVGIQVINVAFGQTKETDFITYENPTLGFTLQHPSNWEPDESEDMIWFLIEDEKPPIFVVSIGNITQYLDTDTLTLKNKTLLQDIQEKEDAYRYVGDYKHLRQNDITVAGNTGIKLEYVWGSYYNFDIETIMNGKLYNLHYSDNPSDVPETVKLANKVVESFHFQNRSDTK
jgi:hypothetical protein